MLGQSRYQTSEFPATAEFPTELFAHTILHLQGGAKHSPSVGSWEGALSYERGTPVQGGAAPGRPPAKIVGMALFPFLIHVLAFFAVSVGKVGERERERGNRL